MVAAILFGAAWAIHGLLFWLDFHGYARGWTSLDRNRRRYPFGEDRYRRREPGGEAEMRATVRIRRFGGAMAIVVGLVFIIVGIVGIVCPGAFTGPAR